MELVQSPIYTDSDLQALHTLVLPLLLQYSSQPCPTEPGSPCGDHPTHLLDDDAVLTGAVQPQLLQDAPHLEQGQAVTAQGSTGSSWVRDSSSSSDRGDSQEMGPLQL